MSLGFLASLGTEQLFPNCLIIREPGTLQSVDLKPHPGGFGPVGVGVDAEETQFSAIFPPRYKAVFFCIYYAR